MLPCESQGENLRRTRIESTGIKRTSSLQLEPHELEFKAPCFRNISKGVRLGGHIAGMVKDSSCFAGGSRRSMLPLLAGGKVD